jgi:hypothetical protein
LLAEQDSLRMYEAFISYARADAKAFAHRLKADLEAQGLRVWLDVSDMPSGDTFIAEIDRAIEAADYFLLVNTSGAILSPYCRDEWAKALEKAKPIIPLLLAGDYDELPTEAHARLNDARDFRAEAEYAEQLSRLVAQLRHPPKKAASLYNVPSLPSYYLNRPLDLGDLSQALTAHKTTVLTSVSKRLGVQGMGGIGKSVLTAALARDYFVRRTFSDGIFWLTFGTQPDLKRLWGMLRGWLEGNNEPYKDAYEARQAFEQLTREREYLLILDDVWESEHLTPFLNLGDKSRLLVTTRFATILDSIDAYSYALGLLNVTQARELFAKTADTPLDKLYPEAEAIIGHCENLPLAISVVGAMVKRKPRTYWADALEALRESDFEALAAKFPDYPYPNLFAALKVSIDALKPELRERYYDFAVFPDDVSIPEAVPITFWTPLKPRQTRQFLDELVGRNLLRRADDASLTLHDLLLTYLRREASDLVGRHQRLLANYNPSGAGWHTVADDGYLYSHLVYHLEAVEDFPSIRTLFADQAWMQARVPASDYLYDGYLRDLDAFWRDAETRTLAESRAGQPIVAFADALRCALIHTSVNSLASNYPPPLVRRAVELGLWSVERALSIVRRIPGKKRRVDMWAELLGTGLLSESQQTEVLVLALQNALNVKDEYNRALACLALAPYDPVSKQYAYNFSRALKDGHKRAVALVKLANLDSTYAVEALSQIENIQNGRKRAYTLIDLIPALDESLLTAAQTVLAAIEDDYGRVIAQGKLACHFPALLPKALEAARGLKYLNLRRQALAVLLPVAPDLLRMILTDLETGKASDAARLSIYLRCLPFAPQYILQALELAHTLKDELDRFEAYLDLAPYVPEVVASALELTRRFENHEVQANVLKRLAPFLGSDLLPSALSLSQDIHDEVERTEALLSLAPYNPAALPAAFESAQNIQHAQTRLRLRAVLAAQRLEPFEALVAEARACPHKPTRAQALAALAAFDPQFLPEALATARSLKHMTTRAQVLTSLLPLQADILDETLETACACEGEYDREQALMALSPYLRAEHLPLVLKTVRGFRQANNRAQALGMLSRFDPDLYAETYAAAYEADSLYVRARTLAALSRINPALLGEALTTAETIEDEKYRAIALAAFLPLVDETSRQTLLKQIHQFMLSQLRKQANRKRGSIFWFCQLRALFSPPILPEEALAAIVHHGAEIGNRWVWL